MIYQALSNLTNLLYKEFCKTYGEIITKDVVVEFLNRLDDLRLVGPEYVKYLHDYVMDFDLWG